MSTDYGFAVLDAFGGTMEDDSHSAWKKPENVARMREAGVPEDQMREAYEDAWQMQEQP